MTDAQKVQLAAVEARKELRALALTEDATAEDIQAATKKVDDLEARAAILTAAEEAENGPDKVTETEDAEAREFRALEGRVEVSQYIGAAMEGRGVDGAEAEYNGALKMGAGRFPLRLLAPEVRAKTDTDAGATQATWVDRLFADTMAARLGITMPTVAPGVSSYPVTTAGASAAQRGRTEAAADAGWTVGVTELKPKRNAVRAVFSVEDAARLRGLEDSLRRDLRMALTEGVDRAIFAGDAGANEDVADVTGLTTAANVTEKTLTQAAKIKAGDTLAAFVSLIDGKHAASMGDLNIVATVGAATLWEGQILSVSASETASVFKTLAAFLRQAGLTWGVRGDLETATSNGKFGAFIGRNRGIRGAGVAPIWSSAQLIRDPYSKAASGEVALTLSYLWSFGLPRPSNFARLKFVT